MGVWKKGSLAVSVSRQRVIRAKTLKRGAELPLHREETERGARARLFPVSAQSGHGREREADG